MAKPWFMYKVTKGFSDPQHGNHDGWDFGAPSKTPVISLTGGRVTPHTGWKPWGGEVDVKGGILGPGVTETVAHLDRIDVKPGETVYPGTQLGLSGGEGLPSQYSSGPHVHYSLFNGAPWDNKYAINPGGFLTNVIKNFGVGSGLGASGIDPGDIGANISAGFKALSDQIDSSYAAAEAALANTVKRAGYFLVGMVLIILGLIVLIAAVALKAGGTAEQAARPYVQAAAKIV